jgi:iron complex transport system substrate-binding protein
MKHLLIILTMMVAVAIVGCRKELSVPTAPHPRIVSFSPAITKMIFDTGLGDHVVGVTTQDRLPAGQKRPVVGDAFSINAESIITVAPDVLMVQMNPDHFEAVRRLDPNIRIEHFTIETLDDVAAAMERIGRIAGAPDAGKGAAEKFRSGLAAIRAKVADLGRPRVLFITDFQSLGTAGAGTFIDQMIQLAGGVNVAGKYKGWVTLTAEGVVAAEPDVLICQVAPGEEGKALAFWQGLKSLPATKAGRLYMVSDNRWTIPTGELVGFTDDLAEMIHPEIKKVKKK